eukprot:m.88115 g.88115  ORF g.88115 m.88115 type:complete len:190 (+) comp13144_c0_seq2:86-655(+)
MNSLKLIWFLEVLATVVSAVNWEICEEYAGNKSYCVLEDVLMKPKQLNAGSKYEVEIDLDCQKLYSGRLVSSLFIPATKENASTTENSDFVLKESLLIWKGSFPVLVNQSDRLIVRQRLHALDKEKKTVVCADFKFYVHPQNAKENLYLRNEWELILIVLGALAVIVMAAGMMWCRVEYMRYKYQSLGG